jgi:hypothetical protein
LGAIYWVPFTEYQTGCQLERERAFVYKSIIFPRHLLSIRLSANLNEEGYLVLVNNSIISACHLLSIKLGADLSEKGIWYL